jgi:hypothetical protein
MPDYDAYLSIGGEDDGTNPTGGAISDVNNTGSSGGGNYEIFTGGSSGGGLAEILTNNSNALVEALKQNSSTHVNQLKSDATNLVQAITSGTLLKNIAMNKISSEMAKHGINSKDFFDKKNELLDYAKNGNENVKDSQGNKIIPREVESLHNAEKAIETRAMNETDFVSQTNGMLDSIDGGNGSGSAGDGHGALEEDGIDFDIMSKAIKDMFNLDGIDFDNLPNNLKEGV